ncbi:MAG: hypothetical protein LBM08_15620 [Dysgonamonadaceae bacterium]|jgi:hypothetical protein|nr:hypothetical protein [Dysgonamonadaceae bacterium]
MKMENANRLTLTLGVASTLRRAKSKRPRLQRLFCKAGALLSTRRSVDATPSVSFQPLLGTENSLYSIYFYSFIN